MIKNIQEYVESKQWPNYFDFLAEHSIFNTGINNHDAALEQINTLAKRVYGEILSSVPFRETVQALLDSYEHEKVNLVPAAQSLKHSSGELPKWLAENLINNVQALPSHYTISEFWKFAGEKVRNLKGRYQFQTLDMAKNNQSSASAVLKERLESCRLSLSREFDVPSAPVPGISFDE